VTETPEQREPDEVQDPPAGPEPTAGDEPPPTEALSEPVIPERLTPDHETFTEGLVGGPIDPPPRVRADFPVVFRGYDREVVDAHLAALEEDVAELHATRTPQSAVRRELERLGQETASILQRAHEAADEVARRSRTRADARIEEAERQAEEIQREAEARRRRIDQDTDEVWAERRKLIEDARSMGEALIRIADEALERFPPAEDGGPPVEPPPPRPARRPARPAAPPRLAQVPRSSGEAERRPDEPEPPDQAERRPDQAEPPGEAERPGDEAERPGDADDRALDLGDPSIESVRRIPRPGAPTRPRFPRR
jgi:ElaB/YqjD/DUF883 family membrane-anchored ribosome-binding protein